MREYNLFITPQKTAKQNNLFFVDGNAVSSNRILFDFSFLDTLDIPEEERTLIRQDSMDHCSIANNTVFVFRNPDEWTTMNAVCDFHYQKVYDSKTWKLVYVIMKLHKIKYYHAERHSLYDKYFNENIKEFDVQNGELQPAYDIEL